MFHGFVCFIQSGDDNVYFLSCINSYGLWERCLFYSPLAVNAFLVTRYLMDILAAISLWKPCYVHNVIVNTMAHLHIKIKGMYIHVT